jgi:hypothetical protein
MNKKNILRFIGIIALAAVIGFSFTACGGDDDGDGGSKGTNEVGGRTWYSSLSRTVFDTNGSYTGYSVQFIPGDDRGGPDLDANGKYQWDINSTGTYTWNEDAKTVTLRLEKTSMGDDGKLVGKAEVKSYYTAMFKEQLASMGLTEAQYDAYIKENTGYASLSQYTDVVVNEAFRDRPYAYSFSKDKKSLLIQEALPPPKGTDELAAGKTYNGTMYDYDYSQGQGTYVKDPDTVYEFGANRTYTLKRSGIRTAEETGSYSYDSTEKRAYFSIEKIFGITAAEYYVTVDISTSASFFPDNDAYKAAQTNSVFSRYSQSYDPNQKLVGYLGN